MKLAFDQAGQQFTGWIASCLSCLSVTPLQDKDASHIQPSTREVQRESEPDTTTATAITTADAEPGICYDEPLPVPPMGVALTNDRPPTAEADSGSLASLPLQSQGPEQEQPVRGRDPGPRASKVSMLSRKSRSRMSNRASTNFSFNKRRSSRPISIGSPSNFRVVESFSHYNPVELSHDLPKKRQSQPPLERFQPLDLSIHRPGNRLSNLLTEFEGLQLINDDDDVQLPRPPPKALSASVENPHGSVLSRVPRKPTESPASRPFPLSTSNNPAQDLGRRHASFSPATFSPLIPHFSTRTPHCSVLVPGVAAQSVSPYTTTDSTSSDEHGSSRENTLRRASEPPLKLSVARPRTPPTPLPPAADLQDRPLSPSTPSGRTANSSVDLSPLPPNHVAEWLFTKDHPPHSPSSMVKQITPSRRYSYSYNRPHAHSLSSHSSSSYCLAGGSAVSNSIRHSHATSTTSSVPPPFPELRADQDGELAAKHVSLISEEEITPPPETTLDVSADQVPSVFGDDQLQQLPELQRCEPGLEDSYTYQPGSTVGVAF